MAINFPNSPSPNEIYESNGRSWQWDGTTWLSKTGSAVVGYTGSRGIDGYTGSAGIDGYTGSAGINGYTGSGTAGITRTYFYEGALRENVSNKRFYIPLPSILYIIRVNLGTIALTQTTIQIKKNGEVINTIIIPAGTTYINEDSTSYNLTSNDYLTVDITESSNATNLYVTFVYREV